MIPISRPDLGAIERTYLLEAFDSGWISSHGRYVTQAERMLCDLTSVSHAAVCSNGTVALHLALLGLDVGPGDEVIIPDLSYVATLNAVLYVGATPVIVDVDPTTWCIDPAHVASAITPLTKAVIAVDLYGHPADYAALNDIIGCRSIAVVADAAESIGARSGGYPAAAGADVVTFSFFGNKVITSGEGGAVLSRDASVHETIRILRNQGNNPYRRYFHDVIGYNYRLTNLSAAILTAQLERLPDLLSARSRVVANYKKELAQEVDITPQGCAPGAEPTPWLFSVVLSEGIMTSRDEVLSRLERDGIETRPTFPLLSQMPFRKPSWRVGDTHVAQRISDRGISLPTFPQLEAGEVEFISLRLSESVSRDPLRNGTA